MYLLQYEPAFILINTGHFVLSQRRSKYLFYYHLSIVAPSPPENVVAIPLNATVIRVTWSAPATPNGHITWYEIQYNVASSNDVTRIVLSANQLPEVKTLIGSLKPFTLYQIRIRAATQERNIKWGNLSLEAEATTHESGML